MRSRSKVLLAVAVAAVSTSVVASSALAHGGHREKLGKISKKGSTALKVEVRGTITLLTPPSATAPGSITLSAAGTALAAPAGFEWTCAIPAGSDVSTFAQGNRVKAKCRSAEGTGLTLTRLRHKDKGDKVKVEARGTVAAFTAASGTTAASITINTGVTGQDPVICAVTDRTRMWTMPTVGGTAKVECKSKNGVLTAKKIKARGAELKAKGTLTINADGSITVASATCTVPTGTALPPKGTFVEIKCAGTPAVLTKIEVEDDDDDDHK